MTQYADVQTIAKEPVSGSLTADEKRVLWLTSPCHFLTHMCILVFPAVTLPMVSSLGMPLEDVVRLSFYMYLIYGIGALPSGYLADRWNTKKLLVTGVFAMGTGLALAGFFPSTRSIPPSLFLVGLGASVYHPGGLALISHRIRRRGYALGVNGVWGNLGIAAAPLITGVLTWLFSWQTALIILGLGVILTGVSLSMLKVDDRPEATTAKTPADGGDYTKYFVILCVALVMNGLAYRGNMVLLPAYLELHTTFFAQLIEKLAFLKLHGTATLAATTLTSMVLLVGIIGQLAGGRAADRFDLRRAYLVVHAASIPFVLAMAYTTNYVLVLCAAGFVLFNLGMQPVENSLIAALTPAKWRGVGYAIKFVLTFGVGSVVVYLIGIVKRQFSLESVYVFLAGVVFLLVLSILVLIVTSRRIATIRN